jgi:lipase maturation factor 1
VFYGYQWDALLLETTLLAIFIAPWSWAPLWTRTEPSRAARWLLWWLLFRLMFLSGAVKLTSGDAMWRNLTALAVHYETQPLPTPLAWYAHQLPLWIHRISCAVMFLIELAVPFLLLAPRTFRHAAALLIAGFMVLIYLTGNYTFFNLLTVALCILCLDDAWWARVLRRSPATARSVRRAPRWFVVPLAVFIFSFTLVQGAARLTRGAGIPGFFWPVERKLEPFRTLNSYGLFAVMTNPRPELIIEGSNDGREWVPYELPHKPGNLARRPDFIAPLQPRLDWQLWFAALETPDQNPWVFSLGDHLLRGTPEVLALFATNPFPDRPPHYVRVVRYEYHFTARAERDRNGHWWSRAPLDYYVEPASLR